MRVTNETDETITIEPGETIYFRGRVKRTRVMVGKTTSIYVEKLKEMTTA